VSLFFNPVLLICSDFGVAVAAIYRSALAGFERYFSVFATISTHCREHLLPVATAAAIALGSKKLLLLGTKGESGTTI
jgi:hypothetical protein